MCGFKGLLRSYVYILFQFIYISAILWVSTEQKNNSHPILFTNNKQFQKIKLSMYHCVYVCDCISMRENTERFSAWPTGVVEYTNCISAEG